MTKTPEQVKEEMKTNLRYSLDPLGLLESTYKALDSWVDMYLDTYAATIREQVSKEWEDCIPLETQGKNTEYCEGWNDVIDCVLHNAKEKGLLTYQ